MVVDTINYQREPKRKLQMRNPYVGKTGKEPQHRKRIRFPLLLKSIQKGICCQREWTWGVSFPSSQRCSRAEAGTRPKANEDSYRNNTARDTGLFWQRKRFLTTSVFSSWSQEASGFENSGHGHHMSYIFLEQSQFKMLSHVTPKELLHLWDHRSLIEIH